MEYPPELITKFSPEGYELWLKIQGFPFKHIFVDRHARSEDVWWAVKWEDKLYLVKMNVPEGRDRLPCFCCCSGGRGGYCGPFLETRPFLGFVPLFLTGLVSAIKDLECTVVTVQVHEEGEQASQLHPELKDVTWVRLGDNSGVNGDKVPIWRKETDY